MNNMYINPFICGVIATILAELAGAILYVILPSNKVESKTEIETPDKILKDTMRNTINK